MTFLEIESFLAVVKYGNISVAAKELYVTQPALTRRIQMMEKQLGIRLFKRQKGHRTAQLTDKGAEFYHIAWKWQRLWEETHSMTASVDNPVFSIGCVESVSQYILSPIYPTLLELNCHLRLYHTFSEDAYRHIENGLYDLAFVEKQDYHKTIPNSIQTIPAFSESFVVATYNSISQNDTIDVCDLQPDKEIYVPWNTNFIIWHADNFDETMYPTVLLEHLSLLNLFLREDNWIIVPYTTGNYLKKQGANIYGILNGPPKRIIYYLTQGTGKESLIKKVLSLLHSELQMQSDKEIQSFL